MNLVKKILLGFSLCIGILTLSGCGSDNSISQSNTSDDQMKAQIVDGIDVPPHIYPFLASFASCTASIIDAQWAFTANHCPGVGSYVVAGDHRRNTREPNEQARKVIDTIRHPDWHDVKLLKLESPLILNQYVQPIQLGDPPVLSNQYTVAGWGKTTSDSSGERPDTPKAYLGYATDSSVCEADKGEFCMQGYIPSGKSQPCNGDSGGPVFYMQNGKFYMVGSVQKKAENAKTECGDGFATFARFNKEWVKKTISEN